MDLQKIKNGFSLRATIYSFLFEVVTIAIAVSSFGHAGPSGLLGWITLLPNLPGFMIAGTLAPYNSMFNFAVCVLIVQMMLILSAIFFYKNSRSGTGNVLT